MIRAETPQDLQPVSPERHLLVAMLQRALLDFAGTHDQESQSAKDWLFGPQDPRSEFSFIWVCSHLDLNPTEVLKRVKTMTPLRDFPEDKRSGKRRSLSSHFKKKTEKLGKERTDQQNVEQRWAA